MTWRFSILYPEVFDLAKVPVREAARTNWRLYRDSAVDRQGFFPSALVPFAPCRGADLGSELQ